MLSDFFRINLPYGISRNDQDEWMAFNREYMPLGFSTTDYPKENNPTDHFPNLPIHTKYKGLTEKVLLSIAVDSGGEPAIERDENGKINKVWFYDDRSNPRNQERESKKVWDSYFDKLKVLAMSNRAIPQAS